MTLQVWKMDIFGGSAIVMIDKVTIMLKRCLIKGNYIDCIMKRNGKGELINNTSIKIIAIIMWCYGMNKGKFQINSKARSLWYYVQNPHTP